MGAIVANVLIVLTALSLGGGVAGVIGAYFGLWSFFGLNVLFDSWKTSSKSIDAEHDRNMARQAKPGKQLSGFKLVDRPSLVDERTMDPP